MDFLDPKKKQSYTTRLYLGYVLMAVLICLGAIILLFAAFGYGVKRDGAVVQNGTVFLASKPNDAEIKVTNKQSNFEKTVVAPERLGLNQGKYDFVFLKQGYRAWQKSVDVYGGKIHRLDYIFLFPEKLTTKKITSLSELPSVYSLSPDRKKLLVNQQNSFDRFTVYDISNSEFKSNNITFPKNLFINKTPQSTLKVIEWSSDNKSLLVSFSTSSGKEFALLDISSPSSSVNLSNFYKKKLSSVRLRDKSSDKFFIQINSSIYAGELGAVDLTKIINDSLAYEPYKNNQIVFINPKNKQKTNKVKLQLWDESRGILTIRSLPASNSYLLDISEYDGRQHIIEAQKGNNVARIYIDPLKNSIENNDPLFSTRAITLSDIQSISFSDNARFVSVRSGVNFGVVDLEDGQRFKYRINNNNQPLIFSDWMDGYRLISQTKDKLSVSDFDGLNRYELFNDSQFLPPVFNNDYSTIITVSNKNGQYQLDASSLEIQ